MIRLKAEQNQSFSKAHESRTPQQPEPARSIDVRKARHQAEASSEEWLSVRIKRKKCNKMHRRYRENVNYFPYVINIVLFFES